MDMALYVPSFSFIFLQAYFSEITYYKSMLESKNKVFQKISKTGRSVMDIDDIEDTMVQLNNSFQVPRPIHLVEQVFLVKY